ncbi:MAG: anthranilate synthase component I [Candidatus Hydrothermarchaeota archaeon]
MELNHRSLRYRSYDTEISPVDMYFALDSNKKTNYSYLLESVEGEERLARFSFFGIDPSFFLRIEENKLYIELYDDEYIDFLNEGMKKVCDDYQQEDNKFFGKIKQDFDVLDTLRCFNLRLSIKNPFNRQSFLGGLVGYVSYDIVRRWVEFRSRKSPQPDAEFLFMDNSFVFDHSKRKLYFFTLKDNFSEVEKILKEAKPLNKIKIPERYESKPYKENMSKSEFIETVERAKEYIYSGDIFQVVLARKIWMKTKADPFLVYRVLREINPSPYMYFMKLNDLSIIGSSPETLVTMYQNRITTNPIAGTRPRGKNEEEDRKNQEEMLNDPKELAEHVMLVDLGRNDIGKVSKPGTVRLKEYMNVSKYSHVMHIVSLVEGEMKNDSDIYLGFKAVFPAGTVSGAPKIRAMEIIDECEYERRGIYAGALGYFAFDNSADFAIVIRTITMEKNVASVYAGAGIVADSIPENEWYETENKALALLRSVEIAESLEKEKLVGL